MSILNEIIKVLVRWMNANKGDIVYMFKFTFSAFFWMFMFYLAIMSINSGIQKILS